VIDEQHRFGVEQRDALRDKAGDGRPHMLVMTATPIPRTVAMTVFGDLDMSTLTELPAGRSPIATHVVPVAERPHYLARTWERIREEVAAGRQAYVVAPRIGGDGPPDADDAFSATEDLGPARPPIAVLDLAAELGAGPLAGLRVAILHGRMPAEEKEKVMLAFADGLVDVLVTTTVVEVGVDVPNAVVMVIMDADRFGVSRIDLVQVREGDVLGTAQAGRKSSLRLLRLLEDEELIAQARAEATELVAADPALADAPGLAAAVRVLIDVERTTFLEKA